MCIGFFNSESIYRPPILFYSSDHICPAFPPFPMLFKKLSSNVNEWIAQTRTKMNTYNTKVKQPLLLAAHDLSAPSGNSFKRTSENKAEINKYKPFTRPSITDRFNPLLHRYSFQRINNRHGKRRNCSSRAISFPTMFSTQ